VTVARADFVGSAILVAVTVTVEFDDTLGAVNNPVEEIDPAVAVQVTPVLAMPVTIAVNC